MKKIIISAVAIVAMVGCQKIEDNSAALSDTKASFVTAQSTTTTTDLTAGTKVGIFMYENGATTTALEANVEYDIDLYGNFTEATNSIFYPVDMSVDFYAYSPYQSDMDGTIYIADLTDQSDANDIDLLTSTISNLTANSDTQSFIFDHRLSMMELNLVTKNEALSLEGVVVTLEGVNSRASFDILTGAMIDGSATGSDTSIELNCVEGAINSDGYINSATVTAVVLPTTTTDGAKIVFTFPNGDMLSTPFELQPFTAGVNRIYNVVVGYNYVNLEAFTILPWSYDPSSEDNDYVAEDVTL